MFYANPKPVKRMRLNHFIKVDTPDDKLVSKLAKGITQFQKMIKAGDIFVDIKLNDDGLDKIITKINGEDGQPPIEKAVSALLAFHEREDQPEQNFEALDELEGDELNIFTQLRIDEYLKGVILEKSLDNFSKPILDQKSTQEQAINVERLLGKTEQHAGSIAKEIAKDMQLATHYPPEIEEIPSGTEIGMLIDSLVDRISLKKKEHTDKKK